MNKFSNLKEAYEFTLELAKFEEQNFDEWRVNTEAARKETNYRLLVHNHMTAYTIEVTRYDIDGLIVESERAIFEINIENLEIKEL